MNTPKTKKNSTNGQQTFKWPLKPRTTIILIMIVLLGTLAGFLLRHDQTVSRDRVATLDEASNLLSFLGSSGRTVYNVADDHGCDSRNSVGLSHYVHCEVLAQKFFVHDGDLSQDLRALDSKLNAAGFTREHSASTTTEADLTGKTFKSIVYYSQTKPNTSIDLSFYRTEKEANDYRIIPLIKNNSLASPNAPAYLYGVTIISSYYACTDSLFQIPCPAPPSDKIAE